MKLEITVDNMSEDAVRIVLKDIKNLVLDYRSRVGLFRNVKIKEVK